TSGIESRGELVRNRLVVDEAVVVRRADSLFVQLLRVERTPFNPGDLRTHQSDAVFKILRAMMGPYLLLLLVSSQRLDVLPFRGVRYRVHGASSGECTVEVILSDFEPRS